MTAPILPLSDAYRGGYAAVKRRGCMGLLADATVCPLPSSTAVNTLGLCAAHARQERMQELPLTPRLAAAGRAAGWLYPTAGQTTELAVGFLLGLLTAQSAPRVAMAAIDEWESTLTNMDQPTYQRRWGAVVLQQWSAVLAAFTAARQVGNPRRKDTPPEPCTRCGDPEARYNQKAKRPLCSDCARVVSKEEAA